MSDIQELYERDAEISTECGGCVFATWEGSSQAGCKFNRLQVYKNKGKAEEVTQGNKTFFKIGTICNYFRDDNWADNREGDLLEEARNESRQKVCVVILALDDEGDVAKTIESINAQEMLPRTVMLVAKNSLRFSEMRDLLSKVVEGIRTNPIKVFQENYNRNRCLDEGVKYCKDQYYIAIDAGQELPDDAISNLNRLIAVELRPVNMIVADNYTIIQHRVHKMVKGSTPMEIGEVYLDDIVEKIKFLAKEQGKEKNIVHV